jgi:putative (di)nucleoside polyphosphate hydrolase
MASFESLPYRPCAGLAVFNQRAGLVFIGRRIDGPEHVDNIHVWQMPQGGIDPGEDPWPAALRELHEETKESEIDIAHPAGGHDPEFVEWRWEPMANLPAMVVPFKRAVYERVVQEFSRFVPPR